LRRSLALVLNAGAALGVALVPAAASAATQQPAARAAGDPSTTLTFSVTSGALTMTAPATASLGSGAPGTIISDVIGNVTVTDDRALLAATWTAVASSTNFITGGGTGAENIPATDATYTPGPVSTTGTISASPSEITLSASPQAVVTATAGVGDNTATWDPRIAVSVPTSAVVGNYTATLTESVS
jgi:hypothetical protein